MSGLNRVTIMGNMGRDPEVRYTADGQAIASFSLATSYKPKGGEERTDWHRCVAFGAQAEVIGEYVKKGDQLLVEGRLSHREYVDKEQIKRNVTEVAVERVVLVGGRRDRSAEPQREAPRAAKPASSLDAMDDDIPF